MFFLINFFKKRKKELAIKNRHFIKSRLMRYFYDAEYHHSGLLLTYRQLNFLADSLILEMQSEKRLNKVFEVVK